MLELNLRCVWEARGIVISYIYQCEGAEECASLRELERESEKERSGEGGIMKLVLKSVCVRWWVRIFNG